MVFQYHYSLRLILNMNSQPPFGAKTLGRTKTNEENTHVFESANDYRIYRSSRRTPLHIERDSCDI
jgi:hypothetical protein